MDSNIDAIDRAKAYEPHQKVNKAEGSEKEKERKFAKALKEQMEDDLQRRRKRQQDEVLIEDEDTGETPPQPEPESEPEMEASGQPMTETAGNEADEDKQGVPDTESGHIDVKA